MAALHDQVLDAVVAIVAGLELGRGLEDNVLKHKTLEDVSNVKRPAVLVTLDESRETCEPFSTEDDEHVLPVMITVLDRKDRKDKTDLPDWLAYRQKIKSAFLMQIFEDVVEVWHVDVRPLDVLDLERLRGPGVEDAAGGLMLLPRLITTRRRAGDPADEA